MTTPILFKFF